MAATTAADLPDNHTSDLFAFETLNLTVNSVGVRINRVGEGLWTTNSTGKYDG